MSRHRAKRSKRMAVLLATLAASAGIVTLHLMAHSLTSLAVWSAGGMSAESREGAGGGGRATEPAGQQRSPQSRKKAEAWESHPLFRRIDMDLEPFTAGITQRMVEQAYCEGTRTGFRLQVVGGRLYVAGETPAYESRHLNLKRQLLDVWREGGGLPEGLDVVLEQEDNPTVQPTSPRCPTRGPFLAPSRNVLNASHSHVLLAPDHTFANWLEAHTLSWHEMLPLLRDAAERLPWEQRVPVLFFRGASTGERNLTDPDLSDIYPDLLDIRLFNWLEPEEFPGFVSLPEHCQYKFLLNLPGNTYSGRLKYLLACGSTVVMPDSPWVEFWYHLLHPGQHLLLADPIDESNRGHHLAEAAEHLQAADADSLAGAAVAGWELTAAEWEGQRLQQRLGGMDRGQDLRVAPLEPTLGTMGGAAADGGQADSQRFAGGAAWSLGVSRAPAGLGPEAAEAQREQQLPRLRGGSTGGSSKSSKAPRLAGEPGAGVPRGPSPRQVGAAAAELVGTALVPAMVRRYWWLLLARYGALQTFRATEPHPDALPMEVSVLVPHLRNITHRTCSICVRPALLEQAAAKVDEWDR